jgi:hypothetical protein
MARYTCLFTVAASVGGLQQMLSDTLEACDFDIIYRSTDYLMAREVPGRVSFSKLVTVEVLIDHTTATDVAVQMKCVIKNEELPLQVNNHCRQVFDRISQAIADNQEMQLIETVAGLLEKSSKVSPPGHQPYLD